MEKLKQNWIIIVVGILLVAAALFYIFKDDVTPVKAVSRWRTIENTKKIDSLNRELKKVSDRALELDLFNKKLIDKYNAGKTKVITIKKIPRITSLDTAKVELNKCVNQLSLCDTVVKSQAKSIAQRDTIIDVFKKKTSVLKDEIANQNDLVKDVEKSLRKERTKKVLWQTVAGAAIAGAGYLIITR